MTILRLAHLDAEGLVLDGAVRSLRDQFVTHNWSELLYKGLYVCIPYNQRHCFGLCDYDDLCHGDTDTCSHTLRPLSK